MSLKPVVAWLGIAALAVLGWVSLAHGWADLLAFQGRSALKAWERGAQPVREADWQSAQTRLERALALDPGNPAVAEDLGRLHELRSHGMPVTNPAVAAGLNRSLDYLRRSLQGRPTSPYTWANVALVKSRLGLLDTEFQRAIEHAALLGPWEPEVQLALADIGFRDWRRLAPETRSTIHAAMQRGLKRQADRLFDLALRYGRLDVMCATPGVARNKRAIRCI